MLFKLNDSKFRTACYDIKHKLCTKISISGFLTYYLFMLKHHLKFFLNIFRVGLFWRQQGSEPLCKLLATSEQEVI